MRQGIKRPIQAYLIHGLWIAMTFYWSTINSSTLGQWTLRIAALVGLVFFVEIIVKRNYFEVVDNKLIINDSFLRTRTIDLDKIEKFDIEPGPFSSSKIVLKDKTTMKYLDSQTDDKRLKEFMRQFNIPVE